LFNPLLYVVVRRQPPLHGLTTRVDRKMRRHALTLIVLEPEGPLTGCVCLHALSSFQRTDERSVLDAAFFGMLPAVDSASPALGVGARSGRPSRPSLGEPSKVTSRVLTCQPLFSAFFLAATVRL
jgi:hypothetical protein